MSLRTECEKHEMIGCVVCNKTAATHRVTPHYKSHEPDPSGRTKAAVRRLIDEGRQASVEEVRQVLGRTGKLSGLELRARREALASLVPA
jgi:hypothetical protein